MDILENIFEGLNNDSVVPESVSKSSTNVSIASQYDVADQNMIYHVVESTTSSNLTTDDNLVHTHIREATVFTIFSCIVVIITFICVMYRYRKRRLVRLTHVCNPNAIELTEFRKIDQPIDQPIIKDEQKCEIVLKSIEGGVQNDSCPAVIDAECVEKRVCNRINEMEKIITHMGNEIGLVTNDSV